jgi:hypothetical protein
MLDKNEDEGDDGGACFFDLSFFMGVTSLCSTHKPCFGAITTVLTPFLELPHPDFLKINESYAACFHTTDRAGKVLAYVLGTQAAGCLASLVDEPFGIPLAFGTFPSKRLREQVPSLSPL